MPLNGWKLKPNHSVIDCSTLAPTIHWHILFNYFGAYIKILVEVFFLFSQMSGCSSLVIGNCVCVCFVVVILVVAAATNWFTFIYFYFVFFFFHYRKCIEMRLRQELKCLRAANTDESINIELVNGRASQGEDRCAGRDETSFLCFDLVLSSFFSSFFYYIIFNVRAIGVGMAPGSHKVRWSLLWWHLRCRRHIQFILLSWRVSR